MNMDTKESRIRFFACAPSCLDFHLLKYRWFGAIWHVQHGKPVIEQICFADSRQETLELVKRCDLEVRYLGEKEAAGIFAYLLEMQRQSDWANRYYLPVITPLKLPWRKQQAGWYVLQSEENLPSYVTCLHFTKWSVRIHHSRLCESVSEVNQFICEVKEAHGIELRQLHVCLEQYKVL